MDHAQQAPGLEPSIVIKFSLSMLGGKLPPGQCITNVFLPAFAVTLNNGSEPSYMPMSVRTTDLEGDEQLRYLGMPFKSGKSDEAKARLAKYRGSSDKHQWPM